MIKESYCWAVQSWRSFALPSVSPGPWLSHFRTQSSFGFQALISAKAKCHLLDLIWVRGPMADSLREFNSLSWRFTVCLSATSFMLAFVHAFLKDHISPIGWQDSCHGALTSRVLAPKRFELGSLNGLSGFTQC